MTSSEQVDKLREAAEGARLILQRVRTFTKGKTSTLDLYDRLIASGIDRNSLGG